MYLLNAAITRAHHRPNWKGALIIIALVVGAAIAIRLGLAAGASHHVTAPPTSAHPAVSVNAQPTGPQDTLALVTTIAGVVSALAAVGAMGVAFLAWRSPRAAANRVTRA